MIKLAIPLCLAACSQSTNSLNQALTTSKGCLSAKDFGAIPDDSLDDRVQLQGAINASEGCLQLEQGTYNVTRPQLRGVANIASLTISKPLHLLGNGATISMMGGATLPGSTEPSDWIALSISGSHIDIHDINFDGNFRLATSEQTHLVQINGPASGISLTDTTYNLPRLPGGDCIRLLGANGLIDGVRITRAKGINCARSFIGFQRGVQNVTVSDSSSLIVGDQAVDMEPTGHQPDDCTPAIRSVSFVNNSFARGPNAQGPYTMALSGDGCAVVSNLEIAGGTIKDGGIHISNANDVLMRNLSLTNRPQDAVAPLYMRQYLSHIVVLDSSITRIGVTGSIVKVMDQNGLYPTDLWFLNTSFTTYTQGVPISVFSLPILGMVNCEWINKGATIADWIVARGVGQPAGMPQLLNVTQSGPIKNAIRMAGMQ